MVTKTRSPRGTDRDIAHLKKCMSDLPYYARHHLRIRTKEAQLVPFVFNEAQKVVHAKISAQLKETGRIRAIVLKARQEGVSTLTAGRFFRSIHLFPNLRATVVAHEKDKASALFEFYDRMYQNLIEEVRPPKISTQRGNLLHLVTDSQIVVDTANDTEAGRSTTIQRLHASEMAFWHNAKKVFISLASAVPDTGSEVIIESTANGVGNFFHEMWQAAEAGQNGYIAIFLPWWIHAEYEMAVNADLREEIVNSQDPYERQAQDEGFLWEGKHHKLSVEKLAWRRRIGIPEKCGGDLRMFRQEYPSTAREAFVVSGDTFFDKDALEVYEQNSVPPMKRGTMTLRNGAIVVNDDPLGHVRIWKQPEVGKAYFIGADTASGKLVGAEDDERGGRDFSCGEVSDRFGNQVAQLHGRMPPEVFAEQLDKLGYYYNTARIGVERNHSSGETVVQKLHGDFSYPNAHISRQVNTRQEGRATQRWGWFTTKVTRPIMLDELSEAVRNREIEIFDAHTIKEMFTFIINERGIPGAQEGTHDDRIIARSISLQLARMHKETPKTPGPPKEQDWSSISGAFDYGWD